MFYYRSSHVGTHCNCRQVYTEDYKGGVLMGTSTSEFFVSPNWTNFEFHKSKVKKEDMMSQLDWLVKEVKEKGVGMTKTIIFCNTLGDINALVNWLMMELGTEAFHPPDSRNQEHCILGIYHSSTLQQNKDRISSSLKGDGYKRIVVARTALSMGVNFPDVRYVVMYGPPRSILGYHQEAGRAGRDGLPSDVIIYFHEQQLTHCEDDMKTFLNSPGCIWIAGYQTLDSDIVALQPLHTCCSVCSMDCSCEECCDSVKETGTEDVHHVEERLRHINTE